jgi:hypothetical protein
MHAPLARRAVGESIRLVNRQRVHVGAQTDRPTGAGTKHPDHAGFADAAVYLQPEIAQLFRDQIGGTVFLEAELRVGVDVTPPAGHLLLQATNGFDHGHIPVAP